MHQHLHRWSNGVLKELIWSHCWFETSFKLMSQVWDFSKSQEMLLWSKKVKLLGHIIFETSISIDLDRVEAILKLSPPTSRKELKSFFEKINFIWKFISGFAEIVHPLNDMLKKNVKVDWMPKAKIDFEDVKEVIYTKLVRVSPNY